MPSSCRAIDFHAVVQRRPVIVRDLLVRDQFCRECRRRRSSSVRVFQAGFSGRAAQVGTSNLGPWHDARCSSSPRRPLGIIKIGPRRHGLTREQLMLGGELESEASITSWTSSGSRWSIQDRLEWWEFLVSGHPGTQPTNGCHRTAKNPALRTDALEVSDQNHAEIHARWIDRAPCWRRTTAQ